MLFIRKIDKQGFFVEDAFVEELDEFSIKTPCLEGFYKPKWDGQKWIEGLTQEEIDELINQPNLPTAEQRIDMLENMILMMMEV